MRFQRLDTELVSGRAGPGNQRGWLAIPWSFQLQGQVCRVSVIPPLSREAPSLDSPPIHTDTSPLPHDRKAEHLSLKGNRPQALEKSKVLGP